MGGSCFKGAPAYRSLSISVPELSIFGEATVETEKPRDQFVKSGNDYYDQGKFREAIRFHWEALEIAERLEDKIEEARARGNIGNAYRNLGDFKEAIEYLTQELEIAKNVDKAREIDAYGNRGTDYFCLGKFSEAKEDHRRELFEAEAFGDEELIGKAYSRLGTDYYGTKEFAEGIKYHIIHFEKALKMEDEKEQGLAYGNIGIGFRKIKQFQKAKDYHKQELEIAKKTGNKAGEANALLNLGAAYHGLCRFGDAKCCHQGGLKLAKKMSAKVVCGDALYMLGRDFECKGSLKKAVDNYQRSVDFYNKVRGSLKGEDNWAISFRDSHQKAYTALWWTLLRLNRPYEALSAVEQGRAQALVDLLHLRHGVQKPDLPEETIQSCTAPGKISTQTVYFAIESNTIHFWVFSIEKGVQCRQFKLNVATVLQRILETAERHSFDSLRNMYDLIIAPIRDLLQDGDLIIVPDGPLFLVPYNALQHGEKKAETEYLFEKFNIRIVPSLISLKLISDKDNSSKSGVLLVGVPNHDGLPKLKYAKNEVQSIKKLFEKETQNVTTLIGGQATKEAVKDKIGSVALIHIAAHATKETGEIELTGSDQLTISDVQQANARLVVLSCCYSGQGKITADGVVGIARAFLGAGAHSVLMTLWEIHDRVSMLIMKEFYKRLVERKSASEALNETLKYCKTQYDVKYWAPFVLIGDDVALEFDKPNESMVRIYLRLK